jgi:hypothetical protein
MWDVMFVLKMGALEVGFSNRCLSKEVFLQ